MSRYQATEVQTNGLIIIEGRPGEPLIVIAPMEHYRSLLAYDRLRATPGGAYYIEYGGPRVYSGGTSLPAPARLYGHHLETASPRPTRIIVITRVGSPLSPNEVRALERLALSQVIETGRAEPTNFEEAFGASLGHDGYRALQAFWAKALQWLHPHCPWLAPQILPPFYLEEPDPFGSSSGQRLVLQRKNLKASLLIAKDGFILLPGSHIRPHVVATASVTPSVLREELWAWGALEPSEDPSLWRLIRHVWCASLSAASFLVLGAPGGRTDVWKANAALRVPDRRAQGVVVLFRSHRPEAKR
ncbi:hypothetical protein [Microvirga tunisiensis]|uniref:Uncharacterized protein n=1 Tax=Microvirga tunisiensis TaxID=2108360 RepID=A0A5N7MU06_9HYPH|nr:hypothetical protein [Microvirga tunisiensis]MPR09318.1 hypothetical protein [Microvirga tunisiensis]MPR27526.1 hypothetical protein [Microvirga tunisiensis]